MAFIITHGDKKSGVDPRMTEKGFRQICTLEQFLPKKINSVIIGSAQRHADIAEALDLKPTRLTDAAGSADSLEKSDAGPVIIMASGKIIPYDPQFYTSIEDMAIASRALLFAAGENDIICSGRPLLIALGMKSQETKMATIYEVHPQGESFEIIEIASAV